jgi:hypothetical protein
LSAEASAEAEVHAAMKVARVLARLAFALSLVGIIPAAAIVRSGPGGSLDGRLLWVLVPVLSAAGVLAMVNRRHHPPVWFLTGSCCGFVVLAGFSLGPYFLPSALLLLAAAVVHTSAFGVAWRALLIPAWFLAGATSPCALLLARDYWVGMSAGLGAIGSAPAIVAGSLIFAGLIGFLAIATVVIRWVERE